MAERLSHGSTIYKFLYNTYKSSIKKLKFGYTSYNKVVYDNTSNFGVRRTPHYTAHQNFRVRPHIAQYRTSNSMCDRTPHFRKVRCAAAHRTFPRYINQKQHCTYTVVHIHFKRFHRCGDRGALGVLPPRKK